MNENQPPQFRRIDPESEGNPSEVETLDLVVDKLLNDPEINKLPEDDQGKVAVDRFIGALVRGGDINDYSPDDILGLIDSASFEATSLGAGSARLVTRAGGARAAYLKMAEDPRTANLLGHFSEQLKVEKGESGENVYTLGSMAQLEGYLEAGGEADYMKPEDVVPGVHMRGEEWKAVIADQVQVMSEFPLRTWTTMAEARNLASADSDYIRNSGNDLIKAYNTADRLGVDVELIRRSAELMQMRKRAQEELGARALSIVTGSKVDQYRRGLDRRAGY